MQRLALAETRLDRHVTAPQLPRTTRTAPTETTPAQSRRRLPATQLPVVREYRRGWSVLSIALHVLIVFLIERDVALHTVILTDIPQGAGGPGPAGGGGG